ncbi:MAG: HEAT repeat domain-containing protein [Proteobacteria bacterium]|nr:HEAT repeat domain-containing protein [Pseudomonadota bacterium]
MEEGNKKQKSGGFATGLMISTLAGMAACQIVAMGWIWWSNQALLTRMKALDAAGYVTVPGPKVFPLLDGLTTPVLGALFYSFTVGTGLGILFSLWAWLAKRMGLGFHLALALAAILEASLLVFVNSRGFTLPGTLLGLLVPLAAFLVSWCLSQRVDARRTLKEALAFFLPVVILAGGWLLHLDRTLFLDLRDSLLLSNPAGNAFNEFYYDYTLYPAESFKALHQKLIKTVREEELSPRDFPRGVARGLAMRDYFPVPEGVPTDLLLRPSGQGLGLFHGKRKILEKDSREFKTHLEDALEEFSIETDNQEGVRTLTYYTLVFGFPLFLYLTLFAGLEKGVGFFRGPWRWWLPGTVCMAIGLLALVPVRSLGGAHPEMEATDLLASDSSILITASIKKTMEEGKDICSLDTYESLLTNENTAVRYWTARALRGARCARAFDDLTALARDPHRNVRCKAMESMGHGGNPRAREVLLGILRDSGDWYVQMYAYRALKSLGWTQEWR